MINKENEQNRIHSIIIIQQNAIMFWLFLHKSDRHWNFLTFYFLDFLLEYYELDIACLIHRLSRYNAGNNIYQRLDDCISSESEESCHATLLGRVHNYNKILWRLFLVCICVYATPIRRTSIILYDAFIQCSLHEMIGFNRVLQHSFRQRISVLMRK